MLFAISLKVDAGEYMLLPIDEVYDGDTIKTHISESRLPAPLNKLSIRINGIDTPESPAKSFAETGKLGRASCEKEAFMALKATEAVEFLVLKSTTKTMKVENFRHGKFGGRVLADVTIAGVDVATHLISQGLAIPYHGEKKSHNWCE